MISVAMTTYNGNKYVEDQIRSILSQTLQIDELIIVDDCSTDNTIEIIRQMNDDRIILFQNNKNKGYIESFYQAVKHTSGDYIFLADQDDIWMENKIEEMLRILTKENCVAVCSACSIIDSNSNMTQKNYYTEYFNQKMCKEFLVKVVYKRLLLHNIAQGCTYGFNKLIKDYYLSIHETEIIHDQQIMLIATLLGDVYFINKPLIQYRIHNDNALAFRNEIKLSVPSKQPKIVRFMKKINILKKVDFKNKFYTYVVGYCRIPLILAIIKEGCRKWKTKR